MEVNGLNSSVWAKKRSDGRPHMTSQPGDWRCTECTFSNFSWRSSCFRCSAPVGGFKIVKLDHSAQVSAEEKDANSYAYTEPRGLAKSCFAPRNYQGENKTREIWTYTPSTLTRSSSDTEAQASLSPMRDLGLPYEVQHFILEMMRVILEEGSWGFGNRVIPEVLYQLGLTCSEMVELSKWRTILIPNVPPSLIAVVSNYSLSSALLDAVRIRNAASHRHLCDNIELQKMAYHAQNLMYMYGDISRQRKFQWLREEVNDWEKSEDDPFAKRHKLEQALKSISEKPVGDMDWTPNSVSLEEVSIEMSPNFSTEEDDLMDID